MGSTVKKQSHHAKSAVVHLISKTNADVSAVSIAGIAMHCIENNDAYFKTNLVELFEVCIDSNIKTLYLHDFNVEGDFLIRFFMDLGLKMVTKRPKDGEFSTFRMDNKLYQVVACFNSCYFTLLGSRNIIHSGVTDIAKSWCSLADAKFDDGIVQLKHNQTLTPEIQYNAMQYCRVIARALKSWRGDGYKKPTVGGQSLDLWQKSYPGWVDDFYNKIDSKTDNKLRLAYRGGFTWLKDAYKNKILGDGIVLDANAMYVTMMMHHDLPYGAPLHVTDPCVDDLTNDNGWPLYIAKVRITANIKNKCIPCISIVEINDFGRETSFSKSEYLDHFDDRVVWLTNYDVELLFDNYSVPDIDVLEMYYFQAKRGCFDDYLGTWYNKKINSAGSVRETCKLMYESLSGKFGTKSGSLPDVPTYIDGKLTWEDGQLDKDDDGNYIPVEDKSFRYIPLIIFVTSLARYTIINLAKKHFDRLVYVDTDSIHLIGTEIPDDIEIGTNLGQYKVEALFSKAKYIGLKNYIHDEIVDGCTVTVTKMAGAPEYVQGQLGWHNFCTGTVVDGKPYTKSIIGGTVRLYTKYKICMD